MSRAVRDLDTLRACRTARMKPASIAQTLGRSLKWVQARIAEIEAEEGSDGGRGPAAEAEEKLGATGADLVPAESLAGISPGGRADARDEALSALPEATPENPLEDVPARPLAQVAAAVALSPPAGGRQRLAGLVTKSVYAAHRGVSQSMVSHWISRGRLHGPALVQRETGIRIDVAVADTQLGAVKTKTADAEPKARPKAYEVPPEPPPTPRRDGPGSGPITRPRAQPPAFYNVAPRPSRGRSSRSSAVVAPQPPPPMAALKPVTPDVTRWAWGFVAAGWDVEEVAELFDRAPDALACAVRAYRPRRAAA